jgi:transposase-like protein
MTRVVNQRRYSEAFKRQVLDEIRVGKWSTPYAAGKAYNISPTTVTHWMDEGGLTHLRGRTMEVKALSEVSELQRLRKENRKLKEQLLNEILDHRIDQATLEIIEREYKIDVGQIKKKDSGMRSSSASAPTESGETKGSGSK